MTNTVTNLAAIRRVVLNSFGDTDCEATDLANMDKLYAVEAQIERATFESDDDKRSGNAILMEDRPGRWDDFQENLFLRMQQFA
jgi:hypothetical protein